MDDVLVIGAGPAGLLAAWIARQRGAKVKIVASGIGTTHVAPGWISVLNDEQGIQASTGERGQAAGARLERWIAGQPQHPYALAGLDALHGGLAALREIGAAAEVPYAGDLSANFWLPTALGAVVQAALVPESFAAGDLRRPGAMLITGPAGWRDFYPRLCAENLDRKGFAARGVYFDLPEMAALSQFDATPAGLARLFERSEVRERVAAQLRPVLDGVPRVGFPAVLGLTRAAEVWSDLQNRLGVPVFEIPTLPPSVPGMRLYNALHAALTATGVPILLDMTATKGIVNGNRATGVTVPDVVREKIHRADTFFLATGGLYGGGVTSDFRGALRETVFGLPLHIPGAVEDWFDPAFLAARSHPIHTVGVRVNGQMQPLDEAGGVILENVRVAGRLLAHYSPVAEGSTEGVWLATAYRVGSQ